MSEIAALLERANLLLNQGRPDDAETYIKKALAQDPGSDYALSLLGLVYINTKKFELAIEVLKQAIGLNPENAHYFYLLGFCYYQKNNLYQANVYLSHGMELDPYNAELFGLNAFIKLEEKKFHEALKTADEGLAIDAENITCLNARSTSLNKLRMTDAAISTMQHALAQDPDNEFTHATVGWNYLEKGKHQQAQHHFREALRIAPQHSGARSGLKESLKSKIPPYRWLLQFNYWLHNRGKMFKWGSVIALYIGVRIVYSASTSNPDTEMIGLVVAFAYILFVATSWIINPLANAFLLVHKDGRHALSSSEKWNAIAFMIAIITGLSLIGASALMEKESHTKFLYAGAVALFLMIPLGHMQFPVTMKTKRVGQWMAMALVALGLATIVFSLIGLPVSEVLFTIFLILFVIYSWTSTL